MKYTVVGLGCSGKSKLARQMHIATGIEVVHLDKLFWLPNWQKRSQSEFVRLLNMELKKDSWIFEGYNPETLQLQIVNADVVVYVRSTAFTRTINWLKRLQSYKNSARPDMTEGNVESFGSGYLWWLWKKSDKQFLKSVIEFSGNKKIVVLKSIKQKNVFLQSLSVAKPYVVR